jgi:hypothetical protein
MCRRFPVAFQLPPLASRAVLFPSGVVPSSRTAYQRPVNSVGPQRGYHVPHWPDTTGVGRLLYPGTVVLT